MLYRILGQPLNDIKAVFLVLHRVRGQVLLHHQRHLKDDGMVKLPQIETRQLLDLLQAIHQGIAVNKQLTAGLGNIQVVLEELLNGEKGLVIQAFDGAFLKDLTQVLLAQGGGQLIMMRAIPRLS